MKRIVSYALPAVVAIALFWAHAARSEQEPVVAAPAGPASAAPAKGGPNDSVVIRIDDETITRSEFQEAFSSIPEDVRRSMNDTAGRRTVADELVRMRLLVREARKRKLDKVPDVARAIELNTNNILASAALRAIMTEQKSANLREVYEHNLEQFTTVDARQIVVAYQGGRIPPRSGQPLSRDAAIARARELVGRLRGGAEFGRVAREASDDPTASQGGSIGRLTRGNLPDEIGGPLFALEAGAISEPVVSQLGVHIFQVTDRQVRPFEEVEPVLRTQGSALRAREIMNGLEDRANVELDPELFGTGESEQ